MVDEVKVKIIDLAPLLTIDDTDLKEVSKNGTGSFKETRLQEKTWIQDQVFTAGPGIDITSGTISAVGGGGGDLQDAYDASGAPANITLISGKNLVLTSNVAHFRPPIMTTPQASAIPSPTDGGMQYLSDTQRMSVIKTSPFSVNPLAYLSDIPVVPATPTLQQSYDASLTPANINLSSGKNITFTSNDAHFRPPAMTTVEASAMPSPDDGGIQYLTDTKRLSVIKTGPFSLNPLAYLSDIPIVPATPTLQDAYDASSTPANISLSSGKNLTLSGTTATFRPTAMTSAQFSALPTPVDGGISYLTDTNRMAVMETTPSASINSIAYLSDIPPSLTQSLQNAYNGGRTIGQTAGNPTKIQGLFGSISAFNVVSPGSGYVVGDILTLSGGTFVTAAQIRVGAIDPGGLISIAIPYNKGKYTALPSFPASATGGSGTGATFTVTSVDTNSISIGDDATQLFGFLGVNIVPPSYSVAAFSSATFDRGIFFPQVDQAGADKISAVFPADGLIAYSLPKRRLIYFISNIQYNVSAQKAWGEFYFENNTIATVIPGPATPTPVLATASVRSGGLENFTFLSGGAGGNRLVCQLTYPSNYDVDLTGTASLDLASGSITIFITKNGVPIPGALCSVDIGPASPSKKSFSAQCTIPLTQNDEVGYYIQNDLGTDNPTVAHGNLRVCEK